jgi:hypothetical protein
MRITQRRASSSISATINSLSIVNCPRLIENIALPSSTNGCPSAPANVLDFFNVEVFVDKFDDDNPEGPHNYFLRAIPVL